MTDDGGNPADSELQLRKSWTELQKNTTFSFPVASFHIVSFPIVSFPVVSFPIVSFPAFYIHVSFPVFTYTTCR